MFGGHLPWAEFDAAGFAPRELMHPLATRQVCSWHLADIGSISDEAHVKCLEIVRQSDRKQR